ncbi:MAG: hypothetical protein PHV13_05290 [Candidatus ainarchaeum sp.]|nr:hypothetical protein [Candidatus ainarchaeum sp.]
MSEKIARKPDGAHSGSETAAARTREFSAFKGIRTGPLEIKDSDELLKLAGGKNLRLNGDVVITSDVWEKFPYGIEIDGSLRCSVLKLAGALKVTGAIRATIIEADGDIAAKSASIGALANAGDVAVEGVLEAESITTMNVKAGAVLTKSIRATSVTAKELAAESASIETIDAGTVIVEGMLKCTAARANRLIAEKVEPFKDGMDLQVRDLRVGDTAPPERL